MYETVWDEIINKGEIDKINATNFNENVIMVAETENIVGIEGFKNYYQNYLTGFSDITFTIVDVFGQGDKIVKHWNFKGTHSGEFFGIPASGKTVDINGVTLVLMKDGKIAQERDFLDNLDFLKQLGLIPEDKKNETFNNDTHREVCAIFFYSTVVYFNTDSFHILSSIPI